MLRENCVIGLPVKILSKSTGQDIEDLNGFRVGTISKARIEYGTFELMARVPMEYIEDEIEQNYTQDFSFLPEDLTPLWGDTHND